MTFLDRTADAESRMRRSFAALAASRALLQLSPPAFDDAVNRASAAALHAARALIDSRWAKDSQPGWDPEWRPGMPRALRNANARSAWSPEALRRLLDRFDRLAGAISLPADFTQYLRTLVEDGLDADSGEAPEYDAEEARVAVGLATRMIGSVAEQLAMGAEFRTAEEQWAPVRAAAAPAPVEAPGPASQGGPATGTP